MLFFVCQNAIEQLERGFESVFGVEKRLRIGEVHPHSSEWDIMSCIYEVITRTLLLVINLHIVVLQFCCTHCQVARTASVKCYVLHRCTLCYVLYCCALYQQTRVDRAFRLNPSENCTAAELLEATEHRRLMVMHATFSY
jgi:hypothetical protein